MLQGITIEVSPDNAPARMPDFSDPLALLTHCHRRIEAQLDALERAAESLREGRAVERAVALRTFDLARAHFGGPNLKHAEDEEVSLFPRMRARGGAGVAEVLAAMAELEAQHRTAQLLESEFGALVAILPRDGSANEREIERACELTALIGALYRPHIRVEDALVYVVAAEVLTPRDLQEIGSEMRERRRLLLQRLQVK